MLAYHGTSDGASPFSGNGFFPFPQPPAFDFTQTARDPSSHGKKGSLKENAGIMPLTVKQTRLALQHPFDDNFSVDGVDVNIVTLVGMVLNKEEKSNDVSFVLDDGTSRVDVKCWIDGQYMHSCTEILTAQNGDYVRMYGHLRSFQGKQNIVALSIRLITNFNEITFHFLECIYVRLFNGKSMGPLGLSNATGGILSTFMQAPTISPFHNGLVGAGGAIPGGYAPTISPFQNSIVGAGGTVPGGYAQYTPSYAVNTGGFKDACIKRVQSIFEEPHNLTLEAGLHVDDVTRRMNGFSRKQVLDAIEFLVNEGMIYSTIDDNHHRSANG